MIRAFLFDMDGTLLDTEILWVEVIEAYIRDHGFPVTHEEALRLVYGISWDAIYAEMGRLYPGLPRDIGVISAELHRRFLEQRSARDVRIHESIALLKRLAKDYPVAIVSGSGGEHVRQGIEIMGVGGDIAFYLGEEDYAPGKPDPAGYLLAARRLNVLPRECLVFEDSVAGLRAAKGAGMACVLLSRPGRPVQPAPEADGVLSSLADFSIEAFEASKECAPASA